MSERQQIARVAIEKCREYLIHNHFECETIESYDIGHALSLILDVLDILVIPTTKEGP